MTIAVGQKATDKKAQVKPDYDMYKKSQPSFSVGYYYSYIS